MFQSTKQLIFKVTRGCNLRCSYCYVFEKKEFVGEFMPFDLYEKILERFFNETKYGNILKEGESRQQDYLNIVFHGGEPTTIGKQKFMKYCKVAHQLARRYEKVLQVSIQTNGTLLDDEWIAMFRKYKITAGISFDGFGKSQEERNAGQSLIETILKLKSVNMFNSVLMVLHKSNYKDIWQNFETLRQIGATKVKANRGVDVTVKADSAYELNANELMEAYTQIYNYMMQHRDFEEDNMIMWFEKYLTQTSKGVEGKDYGQHCYTRYCGAGSALIEIEPDGSIQFCGRNSVKSTLTSPGHALKKDVLEINHASKQIQFHEGKLNSIVKNGCNLCHAQAICDGGCISFSNQKFGEPKIDPTTCAFTKMMHKFLAMHDLEIKDYMSQKEIPNESNNYFYL